MRAWDPFDVAVSLVALALLALALLLGACAAPRERITVLDAQPGEQLTVTTPQGTTVLDTAVTTAQVQASGAVQVGETTLPAVMVHFGLEFAALPTESRVFTFHFATGQTTLDATGRATLAALLAEVQQRGAVEIEVTGHTDQVGTDALNDRLSLARAEAVRLLLWQGGLTATFVRVVGRGMREPRIDAPGRAEARNRRVVVLVR